MKPFITNITKIGPAPKDANDRGNPWIHHHKYSDGTVKVVVAGALIDGTAEQRNRVTRGSFALNNYGKR